MSPAGPGVFPSPPPEPLLLHLPCPVPESLCGRRSWLALFFTFLLVSPARGELPRVELLERWGLRDGLQSTSDVFFGRTAEGRFLFKRDARTMKPTDGSDRLLGTYGNLEGELLATRLLREMGVRTPETGVVRLAGEEDRFLWSEFMDDGYRGGGELLRGIPAVPDEAHLDVAALRRLQVLDLWMGNADRHDQNLWFQYPLPRRRGALWPLAFDHSFAFGDRELAPAWASGAAFAASPAEPGGEERGAFPTASAREILCRNALYRGALAYPPGVERYFEEAARIRHLYDDAALGELVASVPREAFGARQPLRRRTEIHQGLRHRRDALAGVLEGALRSSVPAVVGAVALDLLPPELGRRLPRAPAERTVLELRIGGKRNFDARRLAEALRATPLEAGERQQVLAFLARQAGQEEPDSLPGPRKAPPRKGRLAVRAGTLRAFALPLPANPPTRWMLVREPGGKLRGLGGASLPGPGNPVHQVLGEGLRRLPPGPYQTLRALYLPGSTGHYQVLLQDPDGTVRGECFLRVEPVEDLGARAGFRVLEMETAPRPPWDGLVRAP